MLGSAVCPTYTTLAVLITQDSAEAVPVKRRLCAQPVGSFTLHGEHSIVPDVIGDRVRQHGAPDSDSQEARWSSLVRGA